LSKIKVTAWFALTVKPRHEKAVAEALRGKGLEAFLPLYRARRLWSDRVKFVDLPLFPGYIFSRFEYGNWLPVRATLGVRSIVGSGGQPTSVDDAEIGALQAIVGSGLPVEPWPYIHVSQLVRIESGCLAGVEGILIREKDPWRVVVSIKLLQRAVAVEIDREMIRAVKGRAADKTAELYLTA
jgi:transcription antitermination factor NusG